MKVHSTNPSMTMDTPTTQVAGKQMGKDDFLKLFLKQMQTQSPLKPFDSGEMMQQMSQLTALSATEELEKSIKSMNESLGRSQIISSTQLIGKKVAVASTQTPLVAGEGLKGSVIIAKPATDITVEIKDRNNQVVKTIKLPASNAGVADFAWDGLDAKGQLMNPDYYKVTATASNAGIPVQVATAGIFKVNSVTMDPKTSSTILNIEGIGGIGMDDVIKILN